MIKLLTIGNSFSQDPHSYLHAILDADGIENEIVNLFIGGCSLETHSNNIKINAPAYDYELNGGRVKQGVSSVEVLKSQKWDIVTTQQVSQCSGLAASYIPYLAEVTDFIKENAPDAKHYIQETWSYETDSTHGGFKFYDCNQKEMFRRICDCNEMASKLTGFSVIPTGEVIQYVRENIPEFDYQNGGKSLNRDGFHLSLLYGRYLAGLVWYKTVFGGDPEKNAFVPHRDGEETDERLIALLKKAVNQYFEKEQ